MTTQAGITKRSRSTSNTHSAQSMLDRLKPYDEWIECLAADDAAHLEPGGARAVYDKFRNSLVELIEARPGPSGEWHTSKQASAVQAKKKGGKPRAPHRECTDETVIARMTDRAGTHYQSAQLATYFGIPTARMTEILMKLHALKLIRCVRRGGNPTMYYVPSADELAREALRYPRRFSDVPEWTGPIRTGRVTSL